MYAEYFCVKFVIRHYLTSQLGSEKGTVAYKIIMLTAFVSLCDQQAVSSDVDIGVQLCTKIARRMEKLEAMTKQLKESFSIELRTLLEKGAKSVIDLRGKLDTAWAECQKICSKSNHFLVSQPTDEELANQTKLDLEQLNSWINKIDKDSNGKQVSCLRYELRKKLL